DRRMADGEVFDADAGGDLVVGDAVGDRRDHARQDDAERVHHGHASGGERAALCPTGRLAPPAQRPLSALGLQRAFLMAASSFSRSAFHRWLPSRTAFGWNSNRRVVLSFFRIAISPMMMSWATVLSWVMSSALDLSQSIVFNQSSTGSNCPF